jgi:dTDP-4-dehydrorhamnose reductase
VRAAHPGALVLRAGPLFGPWDRDNAVFVALRALAAGEPVVAAEEVVVSPTYGPHLADAALDLLVDGERGVWHLANAGAVSEAELVRLAAAEAGLDAGCIEERPAGALGRAPAWGVLGSERGALMPPLAEALACYVRDGGWALALREAA